MMTTDTYTELYQNIEVPNSQKFRNFVRNRILDFVSWKGNSEEKKFYLEKPRVQFLYIHHVFSDEIIGFEKLLHNLSGYHEFIDYTSAVNKVLSGSIDKPYLVISSDDGFKNNLNALPLFKEYGIKACFFINPSIIEKDDFKEIRDHCRRKLNFPPVEFLTWNDVDNLLKEGHEIGSHTLSHFDLGNANKATMKKELGESKQILIEKTGKADHFAFPYGRFRNFNEIARKMVFDIGYASCASAERGCHINSLHGLNPEELLIRRDHILLNWPIEHVLYFLTRNSKLANEETSSYPY